MQGYHHSLKTLILFSHTGTSRRRLLHHLHLLRGLRRFPLLHLHGVRQRGRRHRQRTIGRVRGSGRGRGQGQRQAQPQPGRGRLDRRRAELEPGRRKGRGQGRRVGGWGDQGRGGGEAERRVLWNLRLRGFPRLMFPGFRSK